jgi:transcriptional regulator with XRE-family HTH domain
MMKNKMSVAERRAFVEEFAVTGVALAMAEAIQNSGMSQREVARRLGVSEARISQILGATGNPTIKTLARLADVLERELRVEFSSNIHVPGQGVEWQVIEGGWNGSVSSEDESSEEEQYVAVAA